MRLPAFARAWMVVLGSLAAIEPSLGHESCCAAKAAEIVGGADVEMVPDMSVQKPETWDDDEDGPWERPLIPKPAPGVGSKFKSEIGHSLSEACPWLLLGLLCTGCMKTFAPSQAVARRYLSGQGPPVVLKGALLGLSSPLCSCGALPIGLGLIGAGAGAPSIIAFLIAAQSAGVDSLIFTIGMLGSTVAFARMIAAGALSVIAGLSLSFTPLAHAHEDRQSEVVGNAKQQSLGSRLASGLKEALTTDFDEVAPSLLLGFTVTSGLTAILPAQGLSRAVLLGGVGGRAAVLLLALPLQFCEHAAVPLAAALQKAGASGGLSFAMLTSLPAINVASAVVMLRIVGAKGVLAVMMSIVLTGLLGSFLADGLDLSVHQIGHAEEALPDWYIEGSKWAMSLIAACAIVRVAMRHSCGRRKAQESHCCGSEKSCK